MKAFLKKLNDIRKQRDMMLKELRFYKRQCAKEEVGNTVLRALRE